MIIQMNVHVVAKSRRRQQTQRIFMPSQRFYNTNFPPLCLNLNLSRPQKFDISFYKFGHINVSCTSCRENNVNQKIIYDVKRL